MKSSKFKAMLTPLNPLTKLGFQLVGFTRGQCRGSEQEMQQYRLLHAAWVAKPEGDGFA